MDSFYFYHLYKLLINFFLKERNNLVISESNQPIIVGPRYEDRSYKLLAMRSRVSEFHVWSL